MSTERPRRKLRHTLDALRLRLSRAEAVYVSDDALPGTEHVYGVLTRERIERSYHYN